MKTTTTETKCPAMWHMILQPMCRNEYGYPVTGLVQCHHDVVNGRCPAHGEVGYEARPSDEF